MSRALRFRAWHPIEGAFYADAPGDMGAFHSADRKTLWLPAVNSNITDLTERLAASAVLSGPIEMDTGLQDIHGKPVFEGDICRERWTAPAGEMESTYVVRFGQYTDGEGFPNVGFCVDYTLRAEPLAGQSGGNLRPRNSRWEVIGNVHEHAHLLKRDTP